MDGYDVQFNNSDLEPMTIIEQHDGRELPQQVINACQASGTQYNTLERFLIDLAAGGGVNMYGSPAYLSEEYGLSKRDARAVVSYWMETFTSAVIEV